MPTPSLALIPSAYKSGKVSSVLPFGGAGDFDFTRAGEKTRINKSQEIEVLATGIPSIDYTGGGCPSLLLEPQQTQLYGETATMATQTKTVTAVEHTVGFYGTGTITFTGVYSGSLVGTGVKDRVELTFTPTAGSLISTVSGSVTSSQLVIGGYLGSYIPNTTTGTITRIADTASGAGDSSTFNDSEGVLYFKGSTNADSIFKGIAISDGTASGDDNRVLIGFQNSVLYVNVRVGNVYQFNESITMPVNNFNKIALKYKENDFSLWVNGTKVKTSNNGTTFSTGVLTKTQFTDGRPSTSNFYGRCKDIRVYKKALTDAELTALTTL
jgi:hypothetical protein